MAALPVAYLAERHQLAVVYSGEFGGDLRMALDDCWVHRPCFVCGVFGKCAHREPAADLAEMEATVRRIRSCIWEPPEGVAQDDSVLPLPQNMGPRKCCRAASQLLDGLHGFAGLEAVSR